MGLPTGLWALFFVLFANSNGFWGSAFRADVAPAFPALTKSRQAADQSSIDSGCSPRISTSWHGGTVAVPFVPYVERQRQAFLRGLRPLLGGVEDASNHEAEINQQKD